MNDLLLQRLYEAEKRLPEPNLAKVYSYEGWRSVLMNDNGFHIIEGVRVPWSGKSDDDAN